MSSTQSVCVFLALGIQNAMRMRRIVIWGLPPLYKNFPHYLINGKILDKGKLLNTKCVFWFSLQLWSETFFILRRDERDMIKNIYIGHHVKYSILLSDFN